MSAPASSYCQFERAASEPRSWMVNHGLGDPSLANHGPAAPYRVTHTTYKCPRCLREVDHITGHPGEQTLESFLERVRTPHALCSGAVNPMNDHSRTKRVTRGEQKAWRAGPLKK